MDLYSYKGSYPYELPTNMTGYDIADFILVQTQPSLQPGEVLEWSGTEWQVRGPNDSETDLKVFACRELRTKLLKESDWTQLPDTSINSILWAVYRQKLRDISKSPGFPWAFEWPSSP
jgi:hypothetical protein